MLYKQTYMYNNTSEVLQLRQKQFQQKWNKNLKVFRFQNDTI